MERQPAVDVARLIDSTPLGWFHAIVLLNTCMIMFMEGYDMQVTSYAAPAIIKSWHLTSAYLGPVFGFGLFGYLLGATILGHMGDRFGRKRAILYGSLFFGGFTLLAAFCTSLTQLFVLRFLAGIGIGASIPSAIAIAVEYAPTHLRARTISFLFLGYTLGATLGGFIAVRLIPAFGWPAVFVVGGIAPLVIAVVGLFTLPESIRFLALRQDEPQRVQAVLSRLHPGLNLSDNTRLFVPEQQHRGLPLKQLFTNGRASMTILLWAAFISSLLAHYFLTSWLPTILAGAAVPLSYAIISGALLQGGGGIGGLLLCYLSDTKSVLFIALSFCLAAPFIIFIPHARGTSLLILCFLAGFFLVGGQIRLNSIAGTMYPTDIRATGAGWALGVGRIGSIVGPVLGGVFLAMRVPTQTLFLWTALVVVACAVSIALLWKISAAARPAEVSRVHL